MIYTIYTCISEMFYSERKRNNDLGITFNHNTIKNYFLDTV